MYSVLVEILIQTLQFVHISSQSQHFLLQHGSTVLLSTQTLKYNEAFILNLLCKYRDNITPKSIVLLKQDH